MPELASGSGPYSIGRRWGVFPPTMDPTKESTYTFLNAFIAEMGTLVPDTYWHIGGDEVDPNTTEWKTSPHIQAFMKAHHYATTDELQAYFNRRLIPLLTKQGKEVVGWDEILQPTLPTKAVIQSWRGSNYLVDAARQGRRAILSAPYYLDHIKTAGDHYLSDPLPAGHNLTAAQQALVLGGEACMWGEYVTNETIESRIWPRLGAIAERFWSPASVRDVPDMYRRLEVASLRIAEVGPGHEEHTDRMIRHFASRADAWRFASLLDYARPRGFGGRGSDQFTPYTRVIDAARPDPWNGWRMLDRAQRAVAGDSSAMGQLRMDFMVMNELRGNMIAAESRAPMAVADALPVAGALFELARIGNQALGYLYGRRPVPPTWRATADSVLNDIDPPRGRTFGLLRPVGAAAVRVLVAGVPSSVP
jgi:hexosaminidase